MKKKSIIILIVSLVLVLYVIPFATVIILALLESRPIDFKEKDNVITVDKYDLKLTIDNSYYNEKDNCYILETRLEKNSKKAYNNSIEFTYEFKNSEGYILGDASLYVDSIKDNDKWKKSITYCDEYAKEVSSYKIKNIYSY